jgi:uncharacterized secreted protein with C-terminal beta-propeller domain
MPTPLWQNLWTGPARRPAFSRQLRLHAEQLEERIAMSVSPGGAEVAAAVAEQSPGAAAISSVEELRAWVNQRAQELYGELFGKEQKYENYWWNWGWNKGMQLFDADSLASPVLRSAGTTLTATAALDATNVQVEGVDEADLFETDGRRLYIITGRELVIVDLGLDEPAVVARHQFAETPLGMYLSEDCLTIIGSGYSSADNGGLTDVYQAWSVGSAKTTITVFDVADATVPKVLSTTMMHGQLVDSRMVDGELRLVLTTYREGFGYPRMDWVQDGDGQFRYVYESQATFVERAMASILAGYSVTSADGASSSTHYRQDFSQLKPEQLESWGRDTVIVTIDVQDDSPAPTSRLVLENVGVTQVYGDGDNLYLFSEPKWEYHESDITSGWPTWTSTVTTTVYKLGFEEGVEILATGDIAGTLLNQFAADERDGRLRVVLQSGWNEGATVQVLEQQGEALVVTGQIGGIAPGEQVRSVRFMGNRVYFVTFRQVDPLFAADLSDPANPRLLGELKIPGFSEYLHPISETLLIGVGKDASEAGFVTGTQVSLFDVSDPANPRELHKQVLAGGNETSSLVSNWNWSGGSHHAFNYLADEQLLALPLQSNNWWSNDVEGQEGLKLLRIDPVDGIEEVALIEHETTITRSLKLDGKLVAISAGRVTLHDLGDPNVKLGDIKIADVESPPAETWLGIGWPIIGVRPILIDPIVILPEESTEISVEFTSRASAFGELGKDSFALFEFSLVEDDEPLAEVTTSLAIAPAATPRQDLLLVRTNVAKESEDAMPSGTVALATGKSEVLVADFSAELPALLPPLRL